MNHDVILEMLVPEGLIITRHGRSPHGPENALKLAAILENGSRGMSWKQLDHGSRIGYMLDQEAGTAEQLIIDQLPGDSVKLRHKGFANLVQRWASKAENMESLSDLNKSGFFKAENAPQSIAIAALICEEQISSGQKPAEQFRIARRGPLGRSDNAPVIVLKSGPNFEDYTPEDPRIIQLYEMMPPTIAIHDLSVDPSGPIPYVMIAPHVDVINSPEQNPVHYMQALALADRLLKDLA